MSNKLKVKFAGIEFQNPVFPASGTFEYGLLMWDAINLNNLGAVVTKTATHKQKFGNPTPRIAESKYVFMNSIGLENPGVDEVIKRLDKSVHEKKLHVPVIASVSGKRDEHYYEVVKKFAKVPYIKALEINISCPNVGAEKPALENPEKLFNLIKTIKSLTHQKIFIKMTIERNNIVDTGILLEKAGADALVLINGISGLMIDPITRKPVLGNKIGGTSGTFLKTIALANVFRLYKAVKIPLIGVGGITCTQDALDYFYVGASAVQIGTTSIKNPQIFEEVIEGLEKYLNEHNIPSINDLIGVAHK